MATFNHVSGQEPSTVTFKLATVTQTRNSSVMHQEIMALGDPDSSAAIAAVLNAVPASTAWGLVIRQVGNSSIQGNSTVAPLAGSTWATRPIQSSAADLQMTATQGTSPWVIAGNSTVAPLAGSTWATRPIQSSAADLQMTATPVAGSTWRTQPGSTLWASSAGFHFDGAGALQTVGSTVSTGFTAVRISDGSTWVVDYAQASTFTSTAVAGGVNFLRAGVAAVASTDVFVMPWGSTLGHQVVTVTDSSNAIVHPGDSANNALRVNVVAGAAGGSTIVTVSTVQGAVIVRSSAANFLASVYQSTAADLNVTVAGYSTIVSVSTGSVRVHQSTGTDLKISESAATAFTYGQVAMNSSAVQIIAANTARKRLLIIQHSTSVDVYLGASTVTAATGQLLAGVKGNQIVFRHDDAVYGITSASTSTVSFSEETH